MTFFLNTPFLHTLKTSENCKVFLCFQGVEKGSLGRNGSTKSPSFAFQNLSQIAAIVLGTGLWIYMKVLNDELCNLVMFWYKDFSRFLYNRILKVSFCILPIQPCGLCDILVAPFLVKIFYHSEFHLQLLFLQSSAHFYKCQWVRNVFSDFQLHRIIV